MIKKRLRIGKTLSKVKRLEIVWFVSNILGGERGGGGGGQEGAMTPEKF